MSESKAAREAAKAEFVAAWEAKVDRPSLDGFDLQYLWKPGGLTIRAVRVKLAKAQGRVRGEVTDPPTLP